MYQWSGQHTNNEVEATGGIRTTHKDPFLMTLYLRQATIPKVSFAESIEK